MSALESCCPVLMRNGQPLVKGTDYFDIVALADLHENKLLGHLMSEGLLSAKKGFHQARYCNILAITEKGRAAVKEWAKKN